MQAEQKEGKKLIQEMLNNQKNFALELAQDKQFMQQMIIAQQLAARGNIESKLAIEKKITDMQTAKFKESLEELWEVFDSNKNGVLDSKENSNLLKCYIECNTEFLNFQCVELLQQVTRNSLPPGIPAELREKIIEVLNSVSEDIKSLILEMLSAAKSEENFEKMLKGMDTDGDGKVVKKEFVAEFMKVSRKLIDANVLQQKMLQEIMPKLLPAIMKLVQEAQGAVV
mmetsp:Transcript_2307/g.3288  ORF Transcript_2307/g.3288 Transcript_2307/m.3288 type:complete len:227 (-) Transcript_2307:49-729(-)|eukprot:CAMPEP_0167742816 /NCGR_PEP_ID=MMETSP0110_2-20121227/1653_1 /TAXON_ID=629695 /ORGANISM="Gymnochlora sp., Strain CCMP2014" /LENGTH=226 /DNA_ID=CAMNT_0007627083 /DNA_START=39 /DNA_END=719 /DNA_ORIENTATION=+